MAYTEHLQTMKDMAGMDHVLPSAWHPWPNPFPATSRETTSSCGYTENLSPTVSLPLSQSANNCHEALLEAEGC